MKKKIFYWIKGKVTHKVYSVNKGCLKGHFFLSYFDMFFWFQKNDSENALKG